MATAIKNLVGVSDPLRRSALQLRHTRSPMGIFLPQFEHIIMIDVSYSSLTLTDARIGWGFSADAPTIKSSLPFVTLARSLLTETEAEPVFFACPSG